MHYQDLSITRPVEHTGELISQEEAGYLINGFTTHFPGEVAHLFLKTTTLFGAIQGFPDATGIRFMYGMESAGDPSSKVIMLIPSGQPSPGRTIPNVIIQPQGYLNHRGELVSWQRTWQFLANHAIHYHRLLLNAPYKGIIRGVFFGKDSLNNLLRELTQADTLQFHFGYDERITEVPYQFKPVLQPVSGRKAYELYMDLGSLCPPSCPCPPPQKCDPTEGITSPGADSWPILDKALVEMYHYVSPVLTLAIAASGKEEPLTAALKHIEAGPWASLIEQNRIEEANALLETTMNQLIQTYLPLQ